MAPVHTPGRFGTPGPPRPGGGGKGGRWIPIATAAAVVTALLVGSGLWYAARDDGDDPKAKPNPSATDSQVPEGAPGDPQAKQVHKQPLPKVTGDDMRLHEGAWLTETVYAKSGLAEVNGFDPATGKKTWSIPLKGDVCKAAPDVGKGNVTLVISKPEQYQDKENDGGSCSQLTAFDLDTGKAVWTETIPDDAGKLMVAISQSAVAISGHRMGRVAADLETGKQLWAARPGKDCTDFHLAGGDQLVVAEDCGEIEGGHTEVKLLDPMTGKPKWTHKTAAKENNPVIASTSPVVFSVNAKENQETNPVGATEFISLDASGKVSSRIPTPYEGFAFHCITFTGCEDVAVGDGQIHLLARGDSSKELVSYSLATGKKAPGKITAETGSELHPLRTEGSQLLVFDEALRGGRVFSVDKQMKETELLVLPDGPTNSFPSRFLYSPGKLYFDNDSTIASSADYGTSLSLGFATG